MDAILSDVALFIKSEPSDWTDEDERFTNEIDTQATETSNDRDINHCKSIVDNSQLNIEDHAHNQEISERDVNLNLSEIVSETPVYFGAMDNSDSDGNTLTMNDSVKTRSKTGKRPLSKKREKTLEYHRKYQADYRKKRKARLESLYNSPVASFAGSSSAQIEMEEASICADGQDPQKLDNLAAVIANKHPFAPVVDLDLGPQVNRTKKLFDISFEKLCSSVKMMNEATNTATIAEAIEIDKDLLSQVDLFTTIVKKYIRQRREVFTLMTKLSK